MIEYRQPVFFSKAVRLGICRRDGLVRRAIHRKPCGQSAARLVRWVISATAVSFCTVPSWSTACFHADAGSFLIAASSASVIIHPQVNSTVRRRVPNDSRCLTRS